MGFVGGTEAALDAGASFMDRLGGYCRYVLDDATRLEFASHGLCEMLGYQRDELFNITEGVYETLVHPDDRGSHLAFKRRLSNREGNASAAYRLIAKDGTAISVHEIAVSSMGDDGVMRSTSIAFEDRAWQEAEPDICDERFSIMKVFGDKDATIAWTNSFTNELLRIDSCIDCLRLMDFVALGNRACVGEMFDEAYARRMSVADVCTLVSTDGAPRACKIWVECVRRKDTKKDSLFCVKAASTPDRDAEFQELLSFSKKLLTSFADELFEFDKLDNSVTCIARSDRDVSGLPFNVRVFADDFIECLLSFVSPKDKERVREFCYCPRLAAFGEDGPHTDKISFVLNGAAGRAKSATLAMVSVSKSKSYVGLRLEAVVDDSGVSHAPYEKDHNIVVRFFGSFGLSVDGRAVNIRSEKAQELLPFWWSAAALSCLPVRPLRCFGSASQTRRRGQGTARPLRGLCPNLAGTALTILSRAIVARAESFRSVLRATITTIATVSVVCRRGGGTPRVCLVGVYPAVRESIDRVKRGTLTAVGAM